MSFLKKIGIKGGKVKDLWGGRGYQKDSTLGYLGYAYGAGEYGAAAGGAGASGSTAAAAGTSGAGAGSAINTAQSAHNVVTADETAKATADKPSVANYSLWSNHAAHQAASDARIAAEQENARVSNDIGGLHAMFGDYTGTDPNDIAQSNLNANARQANYAHYHQAYLDYFQPQLNDQFNTANHNDLFTGVRTGTEGGSADDLRQQKTLQTYTTANQQLGSKANSAVNDLQAGDNARELDLQNQIQHGGDAGYLINSGLHSSLQSLGAAQDAIGGQTLGDVFNNAGSLYEQSQLAQAYGRNGLSLSPSGGSSGGGGLLTGS